MDPDSTQSNKVSSNLSTSSPTSTSSNDFDPDGNMVEQLVAKKNRVLETQLSKLKSEISQKSMELTKCLEELKETKKLFQQQQLITNRLENDLNSKVNEIENWATSSLLTPTTPTLFNSSKDSGISLTSQNLHENGTFIATRNNTISNNENSGNELFQENLNKSIFNKSDGDSSHLSVPSTPTKVGNRSLSSNQTQSLDPSQSLLHIVCGQRDRLRQRVEDLEKEKNSIQESLRTSLRNLEEVKADNIKLYEKLQYVISFKQKDEQDDSDETITTFTNNNRNSETHNSSNMSTHSDKNISNSDDQNNFTKKNRKKFPKITIILKHLSLHPIHKYRVAVVAVVVVVVIMY